MRYISEQSLGICLLLVYKEHKFLTYTIWEMFVILFNPKF